MVLQSTAQCNEASPLRTQGQRFMLAPHLPITPKQCLIRAPILALSCVDSAAEQAVPY